MNDNFTISGQELIKMLQKCREENLDFINNCLVIKMTTECIDDIIDYITIMENE